MPSASAANEAWCIRELTHVGDTFLHRMMMRLRKDPPTRCVERAGKNLPPLGIPGRFLSLVLIQPIRA